MLSDERKTHSTTGVAGGRLQNTESNQVGIGRHSSRKR
jgi:hypothetical protein